MKTLIVPCADAKPGVDPARKPPWLFIHPSGRPLLVQGLTGFSPDAFDRVIVVIAKIQAERHEARLILRQALDQQVAANGRPCRVDICQVEDVTRGEPETVFLALRRMKVTGPFAVKTPDNFVAVDIPPAPLNAVVAVDPAATTTDPACAPPWTGPVLELDAAGDLRGMDASAETARLHPAGVTLFASADLYENAYTALAGWRGVCAPADIIAWLRERRSQAFRVLRARAWEDWSTARGRLAARRRQRTFFVDVDGVLLKNSGQFGRFSWADNRELLLDNIRVLRALQEQGAQLVVVTARTEPYRQALEELLSSAGLRPHAIVMGLHHAERVLVNDFAPTNPYPSATALSIPRDGRLADYL